MTAERHRLVTLDDFNDDPRDPHVVVTETGRRALIHQLEEIASDVGRLRAFLLSDALERIAFRLGVVQNIVEPTAADFFTAGYSIEDALDAVDHRVRRLSRMVGDKDDE